MCCLMGFPFRWVFGLYAMVVASIEFLLLGDGFRLSALSLRIFLLRVRSHSTKYAGVS